MKILILMAGDAVRFTNSEYKEFKPLISVKGKRIVKWTTDSLPIIDIGNHDLFFAIRKDHDIKFDVKRKIKETYKNQNINFFEFECLTPGNLATAYFSALNFEDDDEDILILDSDNMYNGDRFFDFCNSCQELNYAIICYFDPIDNSSKWCFAFPDAENRIIKLAEKEKDALNFNGKPMVGTFYFSSIRLFKDAARAIFARDEKVKNEFFMSQSIEELIKNNVPVFGLKVDNIHPLGTPEDVKKFENL
ncbi:MAG: sugar phosphate nucleotidyltransferase [bacterium]|nr:sugar phosphate nucleotidyltransferase [bacterium]